MDFVCFCGGIDYAIHAEYMRRYIVCKRCGLTYDKEYYNAKRVADAIFHLRKEDE